MILGVFLLLNVLYMIYCYSSYNFYNDFSILKTGIFFVVPVLSFIISIVALVKTKIKTGGITYPIGYEELTETPYATPQEKPRAQSDTESLFDYKIRESYVDDKSLFS